MKRPIKWIAGGVALVAIPIALLAGLRIFQVGRDLRSARNDLDRAAALLREGQPAAARRALSDASGRVVHANSRVHNSVELSMLEWVPVARQNIRAIREAVRVALALTSGGQRLLDTAKPLESATGSFEVPMRSGAIPLDVIRQLQPQLADLAATLPNASEAPDSSLLVGPVRDLARRVYAQSDLRQRQVSTLSAGCDLLAALSGANGPRRFFIAVANAAEMRGTGGMILSYGELTSANGTFSLEHFGPIDELPLRVPAPAPPGTPDDYIRRFSDLGPTLNWRNSNLGADFTYVGSVMEAMHYQATGVRADGIVQIDSLGLAAMMRGTGPVDVEGLGHVDADNVVRLSLSEAYARFPNDQDVRHEVLGDVAGAVFRKLVTGDYPSIRALATALADAAAERRVILHRAHADEERKVAALGVDGALPPPRSDYVGLNVQNLAANKLDYYLDSDLRVTGDRVGGVPGRLRVDVTLTNAAPVGQTAPVYVFGPFTSNFKAGQYVGLATLHLPAGATMADASGDLPGGPAAVTTEAGRTVVSFPVRIEAGQRAHVTLNIQLAPGARGGSRFYIVPVSRVRPTIATVDVNRGPDRPRLRYSGPVVRRVALP